MGMVRKVTASEGLGSPGRPPSAGAIAASASRTSSDPVPGAARRRSERAPAARGTPPRGQGAGDVGSEDERDVVVGVGRMESPQSIHRVRRAVALELQGTGADPLDVGSGQAAHLQAVRGPGVVLGRLARGEASGHQQHALQSKLLPGVAGEREVSEVGRVEGAAEHAEAQSPAADPGGTRGPRRGRRLVKTT